MYHIRRRYFCGFHDKFRSSNLGLILMLTEEFVQRTRCIKFLTRLDVESECYLFQLPFTRIGILLVEFCESGLRAGGGGVVEPGERNSEKQIKPGKTRQVSGFKLGQSLPKVPLTFARPTDPT